MSTRRSRRCATLRISFSVIAGFIALSLIAALSSGLTMARLRRQFGLLQKLGAYTLERQISEGGMATIFLARHALLKRPTAVKILKKTIGSDEFVHRFEREVQLASQLRHPNTVQIYDFGRTKEGPAVLRDGIPRRADADRARRIARARSRPAA